MANIGDIRDCANEECFFQVYLTPIGWRHMEGTHRYIKHAAAPAEPHKHSYKLMPINATDPIFLWFHCTRGKCRQIFRVGRFKFNTMLGVRWPR